MILVTGASGNVGGAVTQSLLTRRIPFRIGTRRPESAEAVALDFRDPRTFRTAVRGCDAVFLLRPPAISSTRKTLNPFLDAARAEGVRQIVFLSVAGAPNNPLIPHFAVEQRLKRGPGDWTILRSGFFAQNFGEAYRQDIVEESRLFVPAGEGRVAFVDVRDIAEVAAGALIDPALHSHKIYTLTGSEAIGFAEAAEILSCELHRSVSYQPASVFAYYRHLRRRRLPIGQILVQTMLHVGLRFGQAEAIDETLPCLLGHASRTFADYVRDYRNLWNSE